MVFFCMSQLNRQSLPAHLCQYWVPHFSLWSCALPPQNGLKPLSTCGQGLPVYAGGTEQRSGSEGVTASI